MRASRVSLGQSTSALMRTQPQSQRVFQQNPPEADLTNGGYHKPTAAALAVVADGKMDHPVHSSFEFVQCAVGRLSNGGSGVCPLPACAGPYSSGSTTGTNRAGRPGVSILFFAIWKGVGRHRHRNNSMNKRG